MVFVEEHIKTSIFEHHLVSLNKQALLVSGCTCCDPGYELLNNSSIGSELLCFESMNQVAPIFDHFSLLLYFSSEVTT